MLFSAIGLILSVFLFLGADFLATEVIKMEGAKYTLMALSPAIFFVCISSVIHGYFLGFNDMKATGSSQVLEQFFKCSLTILIVYLMVGFSPEYMAAGANFATALATLFSFSYLLVYYLRKRKGILENVNSSAEQDAKISVKSAVISVLLVAVPISLSSIITAITRIIDTATITRGISAAFKNGIPGIWGLPTAAQLESEAVRLAGMLSKSDTLTNLPLALNIALATALVPAISSALAVGKKKEAAEKVSFSLLTSILIVLPCAVGYIVIAEPIYKLLYPSAFLGGGLLGVSAVAMIFLAINQTITGVLQGIGGKYIFIPAVSLVVGAAVKIILNILLIRIPEINIYGAAIGTVVCHAIACGIDFAYMKKKIPAKLSGVKYFVKPVFASAVMGGIVIFAYNVLNIILKANSVSTILAIIIGAAAYLVLIFVLHIYSKEEVEMLPKGKALLSLLKKTKLY